MSSVVLRAKSCGGVSVVGQGLSGGEAVKGDRRPKTHKLATTSYVLERIRLRPKPKPAELKEPVPASSEGEVCQSGRRIETGSWTGGTSDAQTTMTSLPWYVVRSNDMVWPATS